MKITLDWGDGVVREYHTITEPVRERDAVIIKTVHPDIAEVCEVTFERGTHYLNKDNQIIARRNQ